MFTFSLAVAALSASSLIQSVAALPKISAVGSKFFTENGDQFFLKGSSRQQRTLANSLPN